MLLYKDMNIEHKNDTGPGPRTMPGLRQLPILPNGWRWKQFISGGEGGIFCRKAPKKNFQL